MNLSHITRGSAMFATLRKGRDKNRGEAPAAGTNCPRFQQVGSQLKLLKEPQTPEPSYVLTRFDRCHPCLDVHLHLVTLTFTMVIAAHPRGGFVQLGCTKGQVGYPVTVSGGHQGHPQRAGLEVAIGFEAWVPSIMYGHPDIPKLCRMKLFVLWMFESMF